MNQRSQLVFKGCIVTLGASVALLTASNFPASFAGGSISPRIETQHSTNCPRVLVLGAAGSGERNGVKASQNDGVGAEVDLMWKRIHADLSALGISSTPWADPYEAADVSLLYPSGSFLTAVRQWVGQHLDPYMASIARGAALFVHEVETEASACPSTTMVAIGYSQGAMAMHSGEVTLSRISPTPLDHISATILLGDGYQVANTKARHFGNAPWSGEGIATWAHLTVTHQKALVNDVPRPATTAEVCNNYDLVCDSSTSAIIHYKSSGWVHTHYVSNSTGRLLAASDWAAALAAAAAP
jgi:hypothetical protein